MMPGAGLEPARGFRLRELYADPGGSLRGGLFLRPRGVPGARRRGLSLGLTPLVSAPSAVPVFARAPYPCSVFAWAPYPCSMFAWTLPMLRNTARCGLAQDCHGDMCRFRFP